MEIDPIAGNLIDDRHFELLRTLHEYSRIVAPQLETAKSAQALNALDRELSNFGAALDAGVASDIHGRHGSIGQLLSIDLLVTLEKYLSLRGLWQEKLHWGLALLGERDPAYQHLDAVLLNIVGSAYSEQGEYEKAIEYYIQALQKAESNSLDDRSRITGNLGVACWSVGRLDEALTYTRQALDAEIERGNFHETARIMANLAQIHFDRGEREDALMLSFDALILAARLQDEVLQAQFTGLVAVHMMGNGLLEKALPIFEEASRRMAALNDEIGLALNRLNHALLCVALHQHDQARRLARLSLATFERYAMPEVQRAQMVLLALTLDGGYSPRERYRWRTRFS